MAALATFSFDLGSESNLIHTCLVWSIGVCLHESNHLISFQAVPVVPLVLLIKVHASVLVDVVVSDDVRCGRLRWVIYGAPVAKRERVIVEWPFDGFPEARVSGTAGVLEKRRACILDHDES